MQQSLTRTRGFIPYILVVLTNAIIDLGHKIIIQNTIFKCYDGATQVTLTALINACILLPFILFFTPSGFLADRYAKGTIIRWTVGLGIPITALIYISYLLGWFQVAFVLTLILATHSAFYSPAKYGYIKEMAGQHNLAMANGAVQSVTIVAILLGGVLFSVAFESLIGSATSKHDILQAIAPCGIFLFVGAVLQTLLACRIPIHHAGNPQLRLHLKTYLAGTYLKHNLHNIRTNRTIWLSVIGLTLFWAINQVLFAAFGAYLKEVAGVSSTIVAQGLLAIGGVGIIIGSCVAGRISRQRIETGIIPLSAIGMAICLLWIPGIVHTTTLGILLAVYGFFGGLFVVPLNALIQSKANPADLGTVLAGNNFLQNIGMLAFLGGTVAASFGGIDSVPIMYTLAIVALLGAIYSLRLLPQALIRLLLRTVMNQRYQLIVAGLEHIPTRGGVLLLGNHTSWIDWAILHLVVPRPVRFVMTRDYYDLWYLRWFLDLYKVIPIKSAGSPGAIRQIISFLEAGECVALFPEGAISRNGQLAPFRRGFSMAAQKAGMPIIPFYLRGLWGSRWSAASDHFRRISGADRRRRINVCFGAPLPPDASPLDVKRAVHQLSMTAWQDFSDAQPSLPALIIRSLRRAPHRAIVANTALDSVSLFVQATQLARRLQNRHKEQNIGILVPTGPLACVANLAVLMAGKTVINLAPDAEQYVDAIAQAGIHTVLTDQPVLAMDTEASSVSVIDITPAASQVNQHQALFEGARFHTWLLRILFHALPARCLARMFCQPTTPDTPAAIVFSRHAQLSALTGICLSHSNIFSNVRQISSLFQPTEQDAVLAALPVHHPLGLTMTLFLPLLEAIPLVCLPSGSNAQEPSGLQATLLCATPTLLADYARNLHTGTFRTLRLVVCSTDGNTQPLSPQITQAFHDMLNVTVYEGYGLAAAPIATLNAPDILNTVDQSLQQGRKSGTEGLPLPGSAIRIVDPQTGIDLPQGETGSILIGGTQIMQGYLTEDDSLPTLYRDADGFRWLYTGTQGYLDKDGFLLIQK